MAGYSPFMRSVITNGAPGTVEQLATLIAAVEANFPTRLMALYIEFDLGGAGSVYLGNSGVSATNCGTHLVPTQGQNIWAFDAGVILTTDVYSKATAASQQLNIIALPIGA